MTSRKAPRNTQERQGATPPRKRALTVRQAYERYYDDHGRFTISTRRMEAAWDQVSPHLATELVGTNLYRKTAAYYQYRVAHGISPATVQRELNAVVSAPIKHCFKIGILPYLPPIYMVKTKANPRSRILTVGEVERLIEASKPWPWLSRTVILLAYTAQRIQAVLELEWSQVDVNNLLIDFNREAPLAERRKGRGVIPISENLYTHLREWHGIQRKHPRVVGELPGAPYFFWRRMVKKAGLGPEVTPHVLRHTIASMLVSNGEDIRRVQLLLGHKSLKTTESVYVHNNPETIRSAVASIRFSRC